MLICLFLVVVSVSAARAAGLPPISDVSGYQRHGEFVWFDLLIPDRAAVRSFYTGLFAWEFSEVDGFDGYDVIVNQGMPIGGMVELPDEQEALWVGSISTDDTAASADQVRDLGGEILEPAQPVENRGTMALVEDNAGAAFILLDTNSNDPQPRPVRKGDWLWTDLFVHDLPAAAEFYHALAGLADYEVLDERGQTMDLLAEDGTVRSGIVEIPWKHVEPIWLPYVRVENVEWTTAQAVRLGGAVFHRYDSGAILLDPAGAAIGVHVAKPR